MSTYNHTLIAEIAPVNANTFNGPMGELDAAIGNLSSLITGEKGSLVRAINALLLASTNNRHLTLNGTDEPVLVSDHYLQIDSLTAETDILLPAISEFGIGRTLIIMVTEATANSNYIVWVKSHIGDEIQGKAIIHHSTVGHFMFRTVASYPGMAGACWVSRMKGFYIA